MLRMQDEGNVKIHRERYLRTRPKNLTFLFEQRYHWMNKYIKDTDQVLEVGCGIGLTKQFITKGTLTMSDFEENPWIDRKEDAMHLSYADGSLDVIIASNMIHHLESPLKFFQEANRVLKVGGRLLVQDINCGFFMRRLLRLMHVEDFNFGVKVFDPDAKCVKSYHAWDGNNAIPNLLFDDVNKFQAHVPYFRIAHKKHAEFFIYIISGGINGRTMTVELPYSVLRVINRIDSLLVKVLPKIFALQMCIVLEKN